LESQFFEPPGFSNHGMFPLVLLQSNTVILPMIFWTSSCLPCKKFIRNLPSICQTHRKVLLSSFHLNGHAFGFCSQTQKLDPLSIIQKTVPKKVLLSAFHLNGHSLRSTYGRVVVTVLFLFLKLKWIRFIMTL